MVICHIHAGPGPCECTGGNVDILYFTRQQVERRLKPRCTEWVPSPFALAQMCDAYTARDTGRCEAHQKEET